MSSLRGRSTVNVCSGDIFGMTSTFLLFSMNVHIRLSPLYMMTSGRFSRPILIGSSETLISRFSVCLDKVLVYGKVK